MLFLFSGGSSRRRSSVEALIGFASGVSSRANRMSICSETSRQDADMKLQDYAMKVLNNKLTHTGQQRRTTKVRRQVLINQTNNNENELVACKCSRHLALSNDFPL